MVKKGLFFGTKLLLKDSQKIFYTPYDHVQYIWKVVQDHIFTLENKLESYGKANRLYDRKRTKVWIFEKFTLRIGLVKYMAMVKKYLFLKQILFSNAPRKFSMHRMIIFNIFGRLSKIICLPSKKIRVCDTSIRRYRKKYRTIIQCIRNIHIIYVILMNCYF